MASVRWTLSSEKKVGLRCGASRSVRRVPDPDALVRAAGITFQRTDNRASLVIVHAGFPLSRDFLRASFALKVDRPGGGTGPDQLAVRENPSPSSFAKAHAIRGA
jgi:hypothetical protein